MTHTHQQTKTPQPSSQLPAHSTWARPAPAFETEHDDLDTLDIETQLANAERLGHHAGRLTVQAKRIVEPPVIQRADLDEEEEEKEETVQRAGGGEGFTLDDITASRINRARDGGQPLPDDVQRQMSAGMGYDFSGVRVHTGAEAHDLNEQLYARAFTTGQDVFFRDGEYSPGSSGGRQLIAHELAHVVQQSTGRVHGSGGMTVRPAGDVYEREAEVQARLMVKGIYGRDMGSEPARDTYNQTTKTVMGDSVRNLDVGTEVAMRSLCTIAQYRPVQRNLLNTPAAQNILGYSDGEKWNLFTQMINGDANPMTFMYGVCYDAVALPLYLQSRVTAPNLQNTTGQGWVPIITALGGGGVLWNGGPIVQGSAVLFQRHGGQFAGFFHAALAVGGTYIRGENSPLINPGWDEQVDLVHAAGLQIPGSPGHYTIDRADVSIHII